MHILDNIPSGWVFQAEMLKKLAILGVCSGVVLVGLSCRKASTATVDHVTVRPASEAIAEADRLYAERADLVKVRQGIVSLRQAQADDQTNYEIAWRLAKFNYYLGSHSDNSTEKEKAAWASWTAVSPS
jgi:hypothetical protein